MTTRPEATISAQGGRWGTPDAAACMLAMEPQLGYFEGEPG